jgi:hypothetical protein
MLVWGMSLYLMQVVLCLIVVKSSFFVCSCYSLATKQVVPLLTAEDIARLILLRHNLLHTKCCGVVTRQLNQFTRLIPPLPCPCSHLNTSLAKKPIMMTIMKLVRLMQKQGQII